MTDASELVAELRHEAEDWERNVGSASPVLDRAALEAAFGAQGTEHTTVDRSK